VAEVEVGSEGGKQQRTRVEKAQKRGKGFVYPVGSGGGYLFEITGPQPFCTPWKSAGYAWPTN
jgi:hypothetical protein